MTAKAKISQTAKEKSKLTKEEWREYTKTVWHIANTSHKEHPAVFPIEIPRRLVKLFSFYILIKSHYSLKNAFNLRAISNLVSPASNFEAIC